MNYNEFELEIKDLFVEVVAKLKSEYPNINYSVSEIMFLLRIDDYFFEIRDESVNEDEALEFLDDHLEYILAIEDESEGVVEILSKDYLKEFINNIIDILF